MILVLKQEVVDRIADDLYNKDCMTYMPRWRAEAGERQYHIYGKDPRKAVKDMVQLINRHNREGT